jgi:RNA polymerase sigma-70 factor (ECF subfamily)
MKLDARGKNHSPDDPNWFTTTHWSVVLKAAGGESPEAADALERLCRTYWYPLYAYCRWRGHKAEDSEDLTQEFFARLLQKNYLSGVGPEKGKFRSFLLTALSHFLCNERDKACAQKRGNGVAAISLDAEAAEGRFALEPVCQATPEKLFEQRWAATLLDEAFAQVREDYTQAGNTALFNELSKFLADKAASGNYDSVAQRLNMSSKAVSVAVHRLRRKYRECVRREVARTVASSADLEDEMQHLFSALTA